MNPRNPFARGVAVIKAPGFAGTPEPLQRVDNMSMGRKIRANEPCLCKSGQKAKNCECKMLLRGTALMSKRNFIKLQKEQAHGN